MTLLELIVVMAVLSALFGIGVGVLRTLSTPDRLAAAQVKDAFRQARLFARRERAPAAVVVDPVASEVYALGLRSVGNWHLEDDAGTGWPVPAEHPEGRILADGVLGSCLWLQQGATLTVPSPPASFDSPHGFGVEAFLAPAAEPRPMILLERPGVWSLRLDEDDRLEVRLVLEGPDGPEEFRSAASGPAWPPGVFRRLQVVFDGQLLHVASGDVTDAEDTLFERQRQLVSVPGAPLHTGSGPLRFRGGLDELRLASVVRGEHQPLPADTLLVGSRRRLHLDPFGHLDQAHHAGAEQVSFRWGDPPRRVTVEFGLLGTVRRVEADSAP